MGRIFPVVLLSLTLSLAQLSTGQDSTCTSLPQYNDETTKSFINDQIPIADEEFDFIIVGTSAPGCVLANRLSANENWRVLVLEPGSPPSSFFDIPNVAHLVSESSFVRSLYTPPNDYSCQGFINKQCRIIVAKGIGGGTNTNYQFYNRGNRYDYDRWVAYSESDEWDLDALLPFFTVSENASLTEFEDPFFHGREGPLRVQNLPYKSPVYDIMMQSAAQAKIASVDYNGHNQFGFSPAQVMSVGGLRSSAYHAFLEPVLQSRPNLKLISNASVRRVLFQPESNIVSGVEFSFGDQIFNAYAQKEVILSAGANSSPKILLLSGIGPQDDLSEVGIPVLKDLPVGKSLMDKVAFNALSVRLDKSSFPAEYVNGLTADDVNQLGEGGGRLTLPNNMESIWYLSTRTDRQPDYPNIAILPDAGSSTQYFLDSDMQKMASIEPGSVSIPPDDNAFYVNLFTTLLHPKSRGYMKLLSSDPDADILLDPKYLSDEEDVENLLKGIRIASKLLNMPALQERGAALVQIYPANCPQSLEFDSDDYWRCVIRSLAMSARSFSTTCPMGQSSNPEAVVDNSFQVHGIDKLRVVDSSVIPVSISATTDDVLMYMLGEKASAAVVTKHLPVIKKKVSQKKPKN
ncbi:glucose dehydrogenase [FAD, quinone]-like [Uranotaenia lowii]|uniref:glucose dehydrogenase [FAD, quinone]-like n=1 Tax=Uranotaenia lowii TaxID=190385 RepID=UPI002478A510|nr:glucose dehydrogenase [FAD, quinone]-like [Uranotaenia lowii]